jgi:hypothetical protein
MRKRVMRRLILDVADPTLVIQYLMADQSEQGAAVRDRDARQRFAGASVSSRAR